MKWLKLHVRRKDSLSLFILGSTDPNWPFTHDPRQDFLPTVSSFELNYHPTMPPPPFTTSPVCLGPAAMA